MGGKLSEHIRKKTTSFYLLTTPYYSVITGTAQVICRVLAVTLTSFPTVMFVYIDLNKFKIKIPAFSSKIGS